MLPFVRRMRNGVLTSASGVAAVLAAFREYLREPAAQALSKKLHTTMNREKLYVAAVDLPVAPLAYVLEYNRMEDEDPRVLLYRGQVRAFDSVTALAVLGFATNPTVPDLGRKLESAGNIATEDRIVIALAFLNEGGANIAPAMPGILLAEARQRKRPHVGSYLNRFHNRAHFIEALGYCLKHPDRTVRKEAVGQLYLMDDPALLRTALTDTDAEIRESATNCLSRLKQPPAGVN